MSIFNDNIKRLVPIVKCILYLPLRSHRDDGQLQIDSDIIRIQGVFWSLLAFRLDLEMKF